MISAVRLAMLMLVISAVGCGTGTSNTQESGPGLGSIEIRLLEVDDQDSHFSPYLELVRQKIREKWGYPCVRAIATGRCDYKHVMVVIAFDIMGNGSLAPGSGTSIQKTSGYEIYDAYASNAIRLSSPFPPPPDGLMLLARPGSTSVGLLAIFSYSGVRE
jgi:outer membrane biosynthesis protein TonB